LPPQSRPSRAAPGAVSPTGVADALLAVAVARASLALRLLSAFSAGCGDRTRPAAASDAGFRDPML
jgi:hypothetical protein